MGIFDFFRRKKEEEELPGFEDLFGPEFGPTGYGMEAERPRYPVPPTLEPRPTYPPPPGLEPRARMAEPAYPIERYPIPPPPPARAPPPPRYPGVEREVRREPVDVARQLELLSSKLDLLKSELDKISQRLEYIEKQLFERRV
jgi:hypothetical protein